MPGLDGRQLRASSPRPGVEVLHLLGLEGLDERGPPGRGPAVPEQADALNRIVRHFSPTDQNQKRLYQGFQPLAFLYRRSL